MKILVKGSKIKEIEATDINEGCKKIKEIEDPKKLIVAEGKKILVKEITNG